MKNLCKCALKDYMSERLTSARKENRLTQEKFSEKLMLDTRSYISLEHGESLCCTLTFIIFLCFICKDPDTLVKDLRELLCSYLERDITAS